MRDDSASCDSTSRDSTSRIVGPHAPGVLEQAVDDDLIVYSPSSESYFTLNRTAREVWSLADGTRTVDGIADELASRYGVEPSIVRADVAEIVQGFVEAALLSV